MESAVSKNSRTMLGESGQHIATLLAGSWRAVPPPTVPSPAVLADLLPHLLRTGSGALTWWKLRRQNLAELPAAADLKKGYEVHRLEAFAHAIRLKQAIEILRCCGGVEPLVSKGWAVARLYPEPALRPYGDFDLHVDPSRVSDALFGLSHVPNGTAWVDLHLGVPELPDRSLPELYRRASRVPLDDAVIRTLGPEDQLRQLCLHFARHGGWRPLWLCDIGMFMESLPAGFDWDYCLHGDPWRTAWVYAVLGTAVRLLQASPAAMGRHAAMLPPSSWMDQVLLQEWGQPVRGDSHSRDPDCFLSSLCRPWRLWHAAWRRFPNPIEAAFKRHALPESADAVRWHQWRYCWSRGQRFLLRLGSLALRQSASTTSVELHQSD
jgi:hypothetical protein